MWEVGAIEMGGGAETLRLVRELKPGVVLSGEMEGRLRGGGWDFPKARRSFGPLGSPEL